MHFLIIEGMTMQFAIWNILFFVVYVYCDGDDAGAIPYSEEIFNEKIGTIPHFIKFFAPW